jgi:hypothetical protein
MLYTIKVILLQLLFLVQNVWATFENPKGSRYNEHTFVLWFARLLQRIQKLPGMGDIGLFRHTYYMEDFEGETQKGLWFYGTRNWLKDLVCFERPRVNGPAKDLCSNEYIYIYIYILYIYESNRNTG